MSHEITVREDGTAEAAFALTPAWHGLGVVTPGVMTTADALRIAQLDWTVEQLPMAVQRTISERNIAVGQLATDDAQLLTRLREFADDDGVIDRDLIPPAVYEQAIGRGLSFLTNGHLVIDPRFVCGGDRQVWEPVKELLCNTRSDNGTVLGFVSDKYQVINNHEAFEFLDALLTDHAMEIESAFSLGGGKKVVLTARLPQLDEIVQGDDLQRYILMSLSHDGTEAIRFGITSVRVVCMNTYQFALQQDGKTIGELSIRHQGNLQEKLLHARRILGLANDGFAAFAEVGRALADVHWSAEQWANYLDVMVPLPAKHDPDWTERRESKLLETRDAIRQLWTQAAQQQIDGIERSGWAAFNAVTQHIDHLPRRGATPERRAEARFNVTMYGAGRCQKDRAFRAACLISGIEPDIAVAT